MIWVALSALAGLAVLAYLTWRDLSGRRAAALAADAREDELQARLALERQRVHDEVQRISSEQLLREIQGKQ